MGRGDYLGEFEQVVLLAVARLGDEAYGMRIRAEIETRASRRASIGAVYATLERLVAKGYARETDLPGGSERSGLARRLRGHGRGAHGARGRARPAGAHVGGTEVEERSEEVVMPPRLPRALLRAASPAADRAVMLGDLDEEFRARVARSPSRARAWYWRQALVSIPPALRLRLHRASPFGDLGADLRLALRVLRRQPAFAVAAILTMTLGAGMTTRCRSSMPCCRGRYRPETAAAPTRFGNRTAFAMAARSWADFVELSGGLRSFSAIAGFNGGSRS